MWKDKGNTIAKIIFKTNKVGRFTLPDFKTYKSREPGKGDSPRWWHGKILNSPPSVDTPTLQLLYGTIPSEKDLKTS